MVLPFPILLIIAYLGGILSIASPCSGLMLPLFFANTFSKKIDLVNHTILFSLGALAFSIPLSLGFSYFLLRFSELIEILYFLFGITFIILGISIVFGKTFLLNRKVNYKFNQSWQSSVILGVVSAVSLGACSGPVLGVVLTASATRGFLGSALLMFIYVLGIITPFILIALSFEKFSILKKFIVKGRIFTIKLFGKAVNIHSTNLISGLLFALIGISFIFFNASSVKIYNLLNINYEYVLLLQDKIIEFFILQ